MSFDINLVAVFAAAIASTAIGFAWYSPALFGREWMRLSGMTGDMMDAAKKKGMTTTYALGFVTALITAYVLAHFVMLASVVEVMGAVTLAFWIWLGFVATVMAGTVLWEGKPWKLFAINAGFQIVSLVVMASILALWM